jgi:hypothetical protein
MTTVGAHGIAARLPGGFEAHIFKRAAVGDERSYPVAHFSSFPLPPETGDFGGGAVTLMGPTDVFAVLFEYGPESLGTRLFAHQGMPRALDESDFKPHVLRRGLVGQAGTQWFFTEGGRPFTFYAVLGSYVRRRELVPSVNQLLGNVIVTPRPAPSPSVAPAPWN